MSAPRGRWGFSRARRSLLSCSAPTCWETPCATCSIHGNVADRRAIAPPAPARLSDADHLATATEVKPADYAPLTGAGHNAETVLEVEGLQTYLFTRLGVVKAVDDVSFSIRRAETLGIVGESGCGTSMTTLSLLRLV